MSTSHMKPKQLKHREIAAHIRARAAEYPQAFSADRPVAVFRFGTFVVRCVATRAAVMACAAKFDRTTYGHFRTGYNELPKMPTLARPPDADARQAALLAECGEIIGDDTGIDN